jgi:Fic family protein
MLPVPYHLDRFPPLEVNLAPIVPLIGPAHAALAKYTGILTAIPNAHVLLSPLSTNEAVLSSRIEGTQATFGEVLEYEAGGQPTSEGKRDDILEVLNYRQAMHIAIEQLPTLPLSQRLVRDTHRVLMQGVCGTHKAPGDYRTVQNWIGPSGCAMDTARYIPISAELIPSAMSAWESISTRRHPIL